MSTTRQFTAIIEREDDMYVAPCPEVDIASQRPTIEQARANLVEALELFFESADPSEIAHRLHTKIFVTRVHLDTACFRAAGMRRLGTTVRSRRRSRA